MYGFKLKMNCLFWLEIVLSMKLVNEKFEKYYVIGFCFFLFFKVVDLLRWNIGRFVFCIFVKVRILKYFFVMYVSSLLIK